MLRLGGSVVWLGKSRLSLLLPWVAAAYFFLAGIFIIGVFFYTLHL